MFDNIFKRKVVTEVQHEFFGDVPPVMRFVDNVTHQSTYQSDLQKISKYFGDLAIQNRFSEEKTLCHQQLVNKVGSDAMVMMSNTSFKYWSDDQTSSHNDTWQRIIWRILCVYPLGFAFEDYLLKNSNPVGPSWNPITQSIDEYTAGGRVRVSPSNRTLSGSNISQAIFMKFFPEYFDEVSNSMIAFSIVDIFSSRPNKDNPLYVSLRNAIRKQIVLDYFPMPYFWKEFVFFILNQSPEDVVAFQQSMDSNKKYTEQLEVSHTVQNINQVTVVKKEPPLQTQSEEADEDLLDIELLIAELSEYVNNWLTSGQFFMNKTGANIHKVENSYYFVYPRAINILVDFYNNTKGSNLLTVETLATILIENNVIRIMNAEIYPPGKAPIPIQLAEINRQDVPKFVPITYKVENNTDIKIISQSEN